MEKKLIFVGFYDYQLDELIGLLEGKKGTEEMVRYLKEVFDNARDN